MFELFMIVAGGVYRRVLSGTLDTVARAQFVLWQGGVSTFIKEV